MGGATDMSGVGPPATLLEPEDEVVAQPEIANDHSAMARLGRVQLREASTAFDDAMHQVMDKLKATVEAEGTAPSAGPASHDAAA